MLSGSQQKKGAGAPGWNEAVTHRDVDHHLLLRLLRTWGVPIWPPKPPNARSTPAKPWRSSILRPLPSLDWREPSHDADDLTEYAHLVLAWVDHDWRHRGMFRFENDALAVAEKALDRRLGLVAGPDEGDDDIVGLRAFLPANDDEVTVTDVGVDHRIATDAKREHILGTSGKRGRRNRQITLAVLLRQQRLARGDASENRYRMIAAGRCCAGDCQRA